MAAIKPLDRTMDKWIRQSQASQPEYEAGVNNPRRDWKTATVAAEDNYQAGVTAAIGRKAFGKGVAKAGTDKWKRNTIEKGSPRWAQGISLSGNAYIDGFSPYHSVIAGITLPPRGPRGAAKNIERVRVIADALHKKKLELQSR